MNNSKQWFAIRVDGDVTIGTGHVMRCLSLAQEARARNLDVRFLTRSLDKSLKARIIAAGAGLIELHNEADEIDQRYAHSSWLRVSEMADARESLASLQALSEKHGMPAAIIVDHYALGRPWHEQLQVLAPIVVIDELGDRSLTPGWLVDQTEGKSKADYTGLVPAAAQLLLGGKYALLRPEFASRAELMGHMREPLSSPLRVLVTMGGVDKHNASTRVLTALEIVAETLPLEVTLVVGGTNPNLASLRQVAESANCPLEIKVDTDDMAGLMATHHLAVGAAGTTSWERCAMGLPSLNLVLAENQEHICQKLADTGAAINLGWLSALDNQVMADLIIKLANEPELYARMVQAAFSVSDGLGCARILDAVLSELPD